MYKLLLLPLICLAAVCNASTLLPDNIWIDSVTLNNISPLRSQFNITILTIDPCRDIISFYPNTIPLVYYGNCDYDSFFLPLANAGYEVILFTVGTVQEAGWFTDSITTINRITVPVYEITGTYASLITNGSSIVLEATPNNYRKMFDSMWFLAFNILLGVMFLGGFVLTLSKFIIYCRYKEFHIKSLPHLNCLVMLCYFVLACIYIIDPAYARLFYNFTFAGILITVSVPLLMISCCFTALFWLQIVNDVVSSSLWKGKYYIICVVSCVTVTVVTIILGVLASCRILPIIGALVIIYVFFVAMSITYIIAGVKLLRALNNSSSIKQSKANNYRRIASGFVLCSACGAAYLTCGLMNMSTPFVVKPTYGVVLPAIFMQVFGVLNGIFQMVFLRTPKNKNSLSSKRSRSHSNLRTIQTIQGPQSGQSQSVKTAK